MLVTTLCISVIIMSSMRIAAEFSKDNPEGDIFIVMANSALIVQACYVLLKILP